MKLISFTPFPPGAFPFEQVVNGISYKWPDVGLDIVGQAKKIASFRKGNGLPRSSVDEVVNDLSEHTCQRLGNDPRFCGDGTNSRTASVQQAQAGGCKTCGAKI